jgi:hypothetical protein
MSRVVLTLFTFFILASTFAPPAVTQGFAAFTVNSAGPQDMDLSTGIITLPEGGEIIDTEREMKLSATFISYKDGEFIEAKGGTSEGPFGLLEAPELRLEVASNTIIATGGISLSKDGLALSADNLTLDLGPSIAVLSGNIKNTEPAFEAAAIVMKLGAGYALLASPFNYTNSLASIQQDAPGSLLQLKQIENEDGTFSYNVSAKLDEAINTELSPYLP